MAKTPTKIKSLARAHTERAIQTLQGIMDQKDAPPASRVAAAQALLDRGWGKAEQYVEMDADIQHRLISSDPIELEPDEWERRYADSLGTTEGAAESAD